MYVKTTPEKCYQRIGKRSRNGEENIPLDYLTNCSVYHDNMLDKYNEECVCLDQLILNGNTDIYENSLELANWIERVNTFIHYNQTNLCNIN